jgi:hypothetical protein
MELHIPAFWVQAVVYVEKEYRAIICIASRPHDGEVEGDWQGREGKWKGTYSILVTPGPCSGLYAEGIDGWKVSGQEDVRK